MERFIIRYSMAIRIGQLVFQYVGPFSNQTEAQAWDMALRLDASSVGLKVPEATCENIYYPHSTQYEGM